MSSEHSLLRVDCFLKYKASLTQTSFIIKKNTYPEDPEIISRYNNAFRLITSGMVTH